MLQKRRKHDLHLSEICNHAARHGPDDLHVLWVLFENLVSVIANGDHIAVIAQRHNIFVVQELFSAPVFDFYRIGAEIDTTYFWKQHVFYPLFFEGSSQKPCSLMLTACLSPIMI